MLKCCHLLSNILLLTSILILRLSTFMMVSHQEASEIAAEDASSKPWMTKHSHLHVQEEVSNSYANDGWWHRSQCDGALTMVNGDNMQMQTSCSPRIRKTNTTPSLQTQLILSTVKYSFMLHNICCQQKLTNIHQSEACLWERWCAIYICKLWRHVC